MSCGGCGTILFPWEGGPVGQWEPAESRWGRAGFAGAANTHAAVMPTCLPTHLPDCICPALLHTLPCPPPDAAPTVGWACINLHKLYRRPRGMYFSANDRGEMVRGGWSG